MTVGVSGPWGRRRGERPESRAETMLTTNDQIIEAVSGLLFGGLSGDEGLKAYAVLDGAAVPGLLAKLYAQPEYVCLYRGELAPDMAEVAPYLVRLEPDSEFADWVLEKGWGRHWGIFALSRADLRALRRHLRTFLIVHDPQGKPVYFRYYDPRVLRVYLPTCSAQELATVFGPVESYLLEDETPHKALRFELAAGDLRRRRLALTPAGQK
jgi:hypothetical protein